MRMKTNIDKNPIISNAMKRFNVNSWQIYQKPEFGFVIGIITEPSLAKERAEQLESELNDDLAPIQFSIDNKV